MITATSAFLLALALASFLTPFIRKLAYRYGWLDAVRSTRKVHQKPIPRLGGVGIVVAFFAPLVGLLLVSSEVGRYFLANPRHVIGLFAGGIIICLLGIWDDVRGVGAGKKFSIQFLVAALMYALGVRVESLSTPWGAITLGAFALPFTMVWIVGVINAMNLIDGLDGLASGVAFVAVATNFVIAMHGGNVLMMLFMAALAGAILGFLIYNFNPASIFMGDSGSMFLGFILATTSIVTNSKSTSTVAMLAPILALGLPIMDTMLAMGRRAVRGVPLFSADKEHVHHRLLALGLSHRQAVMVLYGVAAVFAGVAMAITFLNARQTALALAATALVAVIFVRKLGYFSLSNDQALKLTRERNLAVRDQLKEIAESLQNAAAPAEAWTALQPLGYSMGVAELSLTVRSLAEGGDRETSRFEWRIEGGEGEKLDLRLPLEHGGADMGELHVSWRDGRRAITRDDEIALESVRDHLVGTMRRLAAQRPVSNVVKLKKSG